MIYEIKPLSDGIESHYFKADIEVLVFLSEKMKYP